MAQAHCCICDKLTNTIDHETASIVGYVGDPLCDDCGKLSDVELSRRYDLNHKPA
jgi:hypothetical protein